MFSRPSRQLFRSREQQEQQVLVQVQRQLVLRQEQQGLPGLPLLGQQPVELPARLELAQLQVQPLRQDSALRLMRERLLRGFLERLAGLARFPAHLRKVGNRSRCRLAQRPRQLRQVCVQSQLGAHA